MSSAASALENTTIGHWLAELHMECYKKYLDDYETILGLMDIKETDLKKRGISNSRDRSAMISSLAHYRAVIEKAGHPEIESTQKSLLRRGSLKKLKLRGVKEFLGSSGAKKNKKRAESVLIADPPSLPVSSAIPRSHSVGRRPLSPIASPTVTTTMASHSARQVTSPRTRNPSMPDYEELPDFSPADQPKLFQVQVQPHRVENEYVPSPQGSPRFDAHRMRAHTVSDSRSPPTADQPPLRNFRFDQTEFVAQEPATHTPEDTSVGEGLATHKHLSVISMESGLSFGFDVDKDFNPALHLESQPWYHGRINRSEAESFLHDDGDFLVRENVTMPNTFTLSVRWKGRCDHTLVDTTEVVNTGQGKGFKYHFDGGAFDSVPELVYNHLKYQIPVDRDVQCVLVAPVCRAGLTKPAYGATTPASGISPDGELSPTQFHTLPKNFGSSGAHKGKNRSITPEPHRHTAVRSTRGVSFSPSESPGDSPVRLGGARSASSGNLIDERVIEGRPHTTRHGGRHARQSSDDYELMESVSILEVSPELPRAHLGGQTTPTSSSSSSSSLTQGRDVKYAELKNFRATPSSTGKAGRPVSIANTAPGVKYAEVRFRKPPQTSGAGGQPPFSIYDHVAPPIQSTYQSRAELLAQRVQAETAYAIPKSRRERSNLTRNESSPHPFAQYATPAQVFRQVSTPLLEENCTSSSPSDQSGTEPGQLAVPPSRTGTDGMYSVPNRARLEKRKSTRDSALGVAPTATLQTSGTPGKTSPSLVSSTKVSKALPGYDSLTKLHGLLSAHSTEELASHLTQADAVQFMLAPRPGEDTEVWMKRVRAVTSSSGVFVGLQTLADRDGEKLWKRLYYRHLALSQMVSLSLLSAGDLTERIRCLKRFIELATVLYGTHYGNLYSFVAVMQGMAAPQVTEMTSVWEGMDSEFSPTMATYRELQESLLALLRGTSTYDPEQISIPAIQQLKTVFYFEEPALPGHTAPLEDRGLVAEFGSLHTGLEGVHTVVQHCSQFAFNTRMRLGKCSFDATLLDFFTQDYPRNYLQAMGVHQDNPLERRRRLCVIMDALVDRVTKIDPSSFC